MARKYYAFISYKREDAKWAIWLQHKLEHYRLPAFVRKNSPDLPVMVRPVFKDTTDLCGGILEKALKEGLDNSQYLIVICSPRAARSPWVCKEVQEFIDSGREEYIIPFIVEGFPNSNDIATECFPENLRSLSGNRELLGININDMGRDAAAVKVVARMFNLHFDTLWSRSERERQRRKRFMSFLSLAVVMVALVVGGYFRYQNGVIKEKHDKMIVNQARAVAQAAFRLNGEGDVYLAQKLCAALLQKNPGLTDEFYVPELEMALRAAVDSMSYSSYSSIAIFKRPDADINSIGMSTDGKFVAVGASDTNVYLYNLHTGECETFPGHDTSVYSVAIDSKTKVMVSGSEDGKIYLWDIKTGKYTILTEHETMGKSEPNVIKAHPQMISHLSFSPDSDLFLSCSETNVTRLWNSKTGESVVLSDHSGSGFGRFGKPAVFSSDGEYVAITQNDGSILLYDIANHEKRCFKYECGVNEIKFSPDNRYLASACNDGIINIWNIQDGSKRMLKGHKESALCLDFSPDGKMLVSGSWDFSVRLWYLSTCKSEVILKHDWYVNEVKFSPVGNEVVSCSYDQAIQIYDIGRKEPRKLSKHTGSVTNAAFTPDGKYIVSASADQSVIVWNTLRGREAITLSDGDCICSADISNKKGLVALGCRSGLVKCYDINTGDSFILDGHTENVVFLYFQDSLDRLVTISNDKTIRLWNLETGEASVIHDIVSNDCDIRHVAVSSDGNKIALAEFSCEPNIYIWELDKKTPTMLSGHLKFPTSLSFNSDNSRLVSTAEDGRVYVWNLEENNHFFFERHSEKSNYDWVKFAVVSPDARSVVIAYADNHICFWDLQSDEKNIFKCDEINCASFNSDGTLVATGGEHGDVRIWNVATHTNTLLGQHDHRVKSVVFNDNDCLITSVSDDKTVASWNFLLGSRNTIYRFTNEVSQVVFSTDREYSISFSINECLYWKNTSFMSLINEMQERFKACELSAEEQRRYFLE